MRSSNFKKVCAYLFTALLVFSVGFGFTGCKVQGDDVYIASYVYVLPLESDSLLIGKWQDGYTDWNTYGDCDYDIAPSSMGTSSYEKHTGTVYIRKTSSDSGYLYYKFERDITGCDSFYNPITVPSTGKWCATAFKELSATSVKLCDAYKSSSTYDFPSTLNECVLKYTIENGYFASFVDCTKQ